MDMKAQLRALALVCACAATAAWATPPVDTPAGGKEIIPKVEVTEPTVSVVGDVEYSQITSARGSRSLKMTLLIPEGREPKPAVIFYPGGGFTSANYGGYLETRLALARAGFVVAAAEYRVVPDRFPALVVDAKAAVRYLRAHAKELGVDPERIGVFGDSAGGYVAQMVGTTNGETRFDQGDHIEQSSAVQAVATIYGISDLTNIGEGYSEEIQRIHAAPNVTEALLVHGTAFHTYPGAGILSDREKARDASPMGHVKAGLPPFLILHGADDQLVSPHQSEQLYEALRAAGNEATYLVVEGANHGGPVWQQRPIVDRLVNWFKAQLMPQE